MRVHWLQHADFEDLGCIAPWLADAGHLVSGTRLYAGETPPDVSAFDALVVMGGPMNIYEYAQYPWLRGEKALIRAAVDAGKRVLGICLGAQLLADVLGGPVTRNADSEIGWFPLTLSAAGRASPLFADLPETFTGFHWHGDTYALPSGAVCLATSEACAQQAFALGDQVLGLQFHLEVTRPNAEEWFRHEQPQPARYVQTPEHILAQRERFEENNRWMWAILGRFL
ncbi:type 1 glutamine amidotransferase [Nevskia soli]|uniref:type 1 glutamine amidotransferase n=1 Tax=Nevskia soli TaxID=418856 RepID=UPI0004A73AFD|nr:type 1 glutamine amidotransferase [Nevskia soli]